MSRQPAHRHPQSRRVRLYDMVQLGYNVFDIQETDKEVKTYSDYLGESGVSKLIDLAHSHDVGVIAMKVLKIGGRRQDLSVYQTKDLSLIQAMLKWALENDKIAGVVTEILNIEQMEEDLGVVGNRLTSEERRLLYTHISTNAHDYCHLCGLCRIACPAGLRTADISRCLAYRESYGKTAIARKVFRTIAAGRAAAECRECGACEHACPYGLPVRERTRRAFSMLG